MQDRFEWCDNFGQEVPKPFGVGLESFAQERVGGDDLFVVGDPEIDGAWVVSDVTIEVEN